MTGTNLDRLTPLEKTALLPFWARVDDWTAAYPILRDVRALDSSAAVARTFGRLDVSAATRAGCCLRSRIIDDWLRSVVPSGGMPSIVELGIGLNTRRERVGLDHARWFEIDFEEIIRARDLFFGSADNMTRVAASITVLDEWLPLVRRVDRPTIVILEGVLQYFDRGSVISLLCRIGEVCAGAIVIFDSMSPILRSAANLMTREIADRPSYRWAITSTQSLRRVIPGFRVMAETSFTECDKRLLADFTSMQRLVFAVPGLRRLNRLTMARLDGALDRGRIGSEP
jgi:O-methyltransferase involved in polyketide biosynthesis